jgi:hypothetical protein
MELSGLSQENLRVTDNVGFDLADGGVLDWVGPGDWTERGEACG